MTAVLAAEQEVRDLYLRYKQLALAAGAALVLDAPLDALRLEAEQLVADATAAADRRDAHRTQLRACVDAARELHGLVSSGGADVEAARRTHKRRRREVWKVIPCEYVPCCASAGAGRE